MFIRQIPIIASLVVTIGCATEGGPLKASAKGEPPTMGSLGEPLPAPPMKARWSGATTPQAGKKVEGRLEAVYSDGGHRFLRVSHPPLYGEGVYALNVLGARHGVAVPLGGSADRWRRPDPDAREGEGQTIIRLVGAEPLRGPLSVEVSTLGARGHAHRTPGERVTLTVAPNPEAEPQSALRSTFYAKASAWFGGRGGRSTLLEAYASGRLKEISKGQSGAARVERPGVAGRRRRSDIGGAMQLYTGMTSVEEALQVERTLTGVGHEPPTVPLSEVEGVPLAAHPWAEMMAELPGKPAPLIEPLARRVPAEFLYMHFDHPGALVSVMEEVEGQLGALLSAFEARPGGAALVHRYEQQLIVRRTGLAKLLGPSAASSVAVVARDPFLREGTDVAMLFEIKGRALLKGALDEMVRRAGLEVSGVTTSTVKIAGHDVTLTASPDGRLSRYAVEVEGVLILANTARCMETLLEAGGPGHPSLAQAGDFQYMRALYPAKDTEETGFLFLGDAFVAHVVSPRVKVLQGRRMQARADLLAVSHGALLYQWLEGEPPADLNALIDAGLLVAGGDRHADGSLITLDPVQGPSSSWGRLSAMAPLSSRELHKITKGEAEAYARFRETYQQYWRQFIDPVAVRVRQREGGGLSQLDFDVHILPLLESSEYDELIRMVGKAELDIPSVGDGLQWFMAVGADARLRRELESIATNTRLIGNAGLGWLGDWVSLGLRDSADLWNVALEQGEIINPGGERRSGLGRIWDVPLYALVHIRNKVGLVAMLTGLRSHSQRLGIDVFWDPVATHGGHEIVGIYDKRSRDELAIYYTVVDDVWVVALSQKVVEGMIDQLEGGRAPLSAGLKPVQGALNLRPREGGALLPTLYGFGERSHVGALRRAARLIEALAWRGALPAEASARAGLALSWLGIVPEGLGRGAWTLGEGGVASHGVYGSAAAPRWPTRPGGDSEVTQALSRLAWAFGGVSFDGEGRHRGLKVQIRWARR